MPLPSLFHEVALACQARHYLRPIAALSTEARANCRLGEALALISKTLPTGKTPPSVPLQGETGVDLDEAPIVSSGSAGITRTMPDATVVSTAGATELELFAAYRESPTSALKDRIISRYLDLVPSIVRKFRGRAEWEDLIQVGYVGLIKALENYDPSHAAKFVTYATHCIQGELRHYIRDRVEVIRRPRWLRGLSREVAGCIEAFLHRHHRLPSVSEIAAEINVAEEGVIEILRAQAPISLDDLQGDGTSGVSVEKIRSTQYQSFRLPLEDRIAIQQAMGRLLELEKRIIYLFFYRDFTQSQIAGVVGLSPKKVSRVLHRGLDRLRQILHLES